VTQEELAVAVGVSAQTIRRLERGEVDNPKLRTLVNCAIALGVELSDVIEDDWLAWLAMPGAAEAPESDEFWRRPYRPAR
jgi:transcriptional regulator with XRE-family HTH domain